MKQWRQTLSRVDLFSGLGDRDRAALLDGAEEQEAKKKDLLCTSNAPADRFFVLVNGAVKTMHRKDGSTTLLMDFIKPVDVIGEDAILLSGDYGLDAVPIENCTAICIPSENLKRVMDAQPRLARAMAARSAIRARAYRERLYQMAAIPVPVRLAGAIHHLARNFGKKEKNGTVISIKVTHQDFADYVGAARETVTLFLSRFRKQGLITMEVRKIIVPDMKRLKKAATNPGSTG